MDVQIVENETKGYANCLRRQETGRKMTYSIPSSASIIIDHTEVEPAFEGLGSGK